MRLSTRNLISGGRDLRAAASWSQRRAPPPWIPPFFFPVHPSFRVHPSRFKVERAPLSTTSTCPSHVTRAHMHTYTVKCTFVPSRKSQIDFSDRRPLSSPRPRGLVKPNEFDNLRPFVATFDPSTLVNLGCPVQRVFRTICSEFNRVKILFRQLGLRIRSKWISC